MNRFGIPCIDGNLLCMNKDYKHNRTDGTHHDDTAEVRLKDATHNFAVESIMDAYALTAGYAERGFAPWLWTNERSKGHLEKPPAFTRPNKTGRLHREDAMVLTTEPVMPRVHGMRRTLNDTIVASMANKDKLILANVSQQ